MSTLFDLAKYLARSVHKGGDETDSSPKDSKAVKYDEIKEHALKEALGNVTTSGFKENLARTSFGDGFDKGFQLGMRMEKFWVKPEKELPTHKQEIWYVIRSEQGVSIRPGIAIVTPQTVYADLTEDDGGVVLTGNRSDLFPKALAWCPRQCIPVPRYDGES